jgi:hypothetical protein
MLDASNNSLLSAFRFYHDSERLAQHKQHCQILVHRELPIAFFLGQLASNIAYNMPHCRVTGIHTTYGQRIWLPI